MRALVALLLALPLAGCALPWGGDDAVRPAPTTTPTDDGPRYPPLSFAGRVVHALTGAPVPDATLRLDLAHTLPCERESLVWAAWDLALDARGAFGPFEVPPPDSPTYRFYLHAKAPGHAETVVYVGPESAAGIGNLTIALHPRANVTGSAPPGTLVALDAPR
ncbi:MAG TPA: hypothetical protein VHH36_04445, partial [Candidatus Thermoplasmatota archaeon]|nr:hypothetical protein [Candidatus Thermoplasmatota archaeon]